MAPPSKPKAKPLPAPPALKLGPVTIKSSADPDDALAPRIALLLWGESTVGKSTFAATAPGKKLWISAGDNEHASVFHRDDVLVADYSSMELEDFWKQAASDNPFGLDQLLSDNVEIETVVFDSLTAATYRALQKAVLVDRAGASRDFTPSMVSPGIAAYGGRNALVLQLVSGLLRVTGKHNVHVVLTSHEDEPTMKKNDKGVSTDIVDFITMQLGGKIVGNMTYRLSEVWYMSANKHSGQRKLAIWPTRLRRPMKSRMFASTPDKKGQFTKEFELTYNPDKPDAGQEHTIAAWHKEWLDNGGGKIAVPGAQINE